MARLRDSDAGISRFPFLFALVGLIIVASVVSLVLFHNSSNTDGTRMVSEQSRSARSATPSAVTPAPTTSSSSAPTISIAPITSAPPAATVPSTSRAARPTSGGTSTTRPITYVVHPGDNLTVISQWFKLHGYGSLYERNKAVIGDNPNLIFPGQKITISGGKMTVGG